MGNKFEIFSLWFTPQMPAEIRAEPGSQEAGSFLTCVAEALVCGSSSVAFLGSLSGSWAGI